MNPLVSVLMSVHNEDLGYIDCAVKSICDQTYKNIEFIIIDDASDLYVYRHLLELSEKYNIIKLYRNEANLGLTKTLNNGLRMVNGEYIARMDADDFSCPNRIATQVDYLYKNKDIDIVGTGVVSFGDRYSYMSMMNGANNDEVQCYLFFSSSLCHPSVMIRKSFLERTGLCYDDNVKKAQDYELWERASVEGKLAVIKDVLLYYRLHPNQITSKSSKEQILTASNIRLRRLRRLSIDPTDREILCHKALLGQKVSVDMGEVKYWIEKIVNASRSISYIDSEHFAKHLNRRYILFKMKCRKKLNIKELPIALSIIFSRILMQIRLKRFISIIPNIVKS
ncbi:MAG: glycosyltransferase [Muribaculaceae bacterium]|nr:glycosyltransferase [Muribaculaceae bacterium]